ncbi:MAG: acetate--CoA ligase family protein [Burkholderiales bacterium]
MTIDLTRLLSPRAIAIVGASTNPSSISGQPLHHMLTMGYTGKLYPVNPRRAEVQGVKSYADMLAIPQACDVAVIAVPAAHVPASLEQCGQARIPFAVILSAGFAETGEAGAEMQRRLDAAIAGSGVRVVGPNCVGTMNVITKAYCAFGGALGDKTLKPGPLAIVSQSGGFGLSMMALANAHAVGTSYNISTGNESDLTLFDFAHDFLERGEVKVVAVYMEASTEGRKLRALGRHALEAGKPILMLKVGNSGASRRAANSHTGRLTADYTLFRAAFREGGFIEVDDLDELSEVARLVIGGKYPKGRRVGVLTGSGGWGVITAEQCEKNGLELPTTPPEAQKKLLALDSTFSSVANPIDMMANYEDQYKALEVLLDDPAFDQFIVRTSAGPSLPGWVDRFIEKAACTDKPMIVNWASVPGRDAHLKTRLEDAGFLCSMYASGLARALGVFTRFALERQGFRETGADRPRTRPKQALEWGRATGPLSEHASRHCLAQYGIRATREVLLPLEEVLALETCPVAFPVAVKLASPDIPHKTEADAVRLNVASVAGLKSAAAAVHASGLRHTPGARIDGISIQEMASGIEVILGAVNDESFGPYVMVGLGGVLTEVLHDVAHRFAPISIEDAREMLSELKGARVFEGYRGAPPADVEALAHAVANLSWLIVDHQDRVAEIDVNPLFVRERGEGVVAADALVVLR